jgi:hypothetical protein
VRREGLKDRLHLPKVTLDVCVQGRSDRDDDKARASGDRHILMNGERALRNERVIAGLFPGHTPLAHSLTDRLIAIDTDHPSTRVDERERER